MFSWINLGQPLLSLCRPVVAGRTALLSTGKCWRKSEDDGQPPWRVTPTKMTSSEALIETLVANKVKNIFGIVGSAFLDPLDLLPSSDIRFISVQHEQNAAHMADGYARATGKAGVCIAQQGPGTTNLLTGVAAAFWAHSPVVVITPETDSLSHGLGGFQEMHQLPMFSEVTKYQAHVPSPHRIAELTNRCFYHAHLEGGPVQLNIPKDFLYGDVNVKIPNPQIIERSAGGINSVTKSAEMISSAKNPVILSGGGVVMSGGVDQVVRLAESLQAPVCSTYQHNDSFPSDHPLWMGPIGYEGSAAAMNIFSKADLVLALGTRLGPFGQLPQYDFDFWPKKAKFIQVDINAKKLGLSADIDIGIHGDAKLTAEALTDKISSLNPVCLINAEERLSEVAKKKAEWEDELTCISITPPGQTEMEPMEALRELEKAMPADAMVSTDVGNICYLANRYLRFKKPGSFFAAMSFGNCGFAFPAAMGAKVGAPNRPSIAYVGDGAWGMSMNEMLTCVWENIPVVAVVFENGQWGQVKKNQEDFYHDRFVGSEISDPNFAEISKDMGAEGIKVTKPYEIGPALRSLIASGRPAVLEIVVSKTLADLFRKDIPLPVRHLDKYQVGILVGT